MPLKPLAAIILLTSVVAGQRFARISSSGQMEESYATSQQAIEAENYLETHPEDRSVVQRQVRLHPDDPRILENAATCLRLTDRESAVNWLKQAMAPNPSRRERIVMVLADVYAAAITGVTGMNPWLGPTSRDAAEAGSDFALRARIEAMASAELAARTGWAVYLTTEAFHRLKLSDADYDAFAEELLLRAAAIDYPKPGAFAYLGEFYNRQESKPSGQIHPKSRMLAVSSDEQGRRLLSRTTSNVVTGGKTTLGPVRVFVDIVVGTDGHVWKAVPKNAPSELIGDAAANAAQTWLYQPWERLCGLPQVWT